MSCTLPVGRFGRIDFPPCAAHGTESALQCLWTLYTSRPRCHRRALFKSGERSAVDRAECPLHSKMPFDRATFGRLGWGRYSSCRLAADLDTVLASTVLCVTRWRALGCTALDRGTTKARIINKSQFLFFLRVFPRIRKEQTQKADQ